MARTQSTARRTKKGASARTSPAKARTSLDRREAVRLLREAYERHGYVRIKVDARRQKTKSWEVRLWADNTRQARQIVAALAALDLTSGKPFAKRKGLMVPVYGKDQVVQFLQRVKPKTKNEIPTG